MILEEHGKRHTHATALCLVDRAAYADDRV